MFLKLSLPKHQQRPLWPNHVLYKFLKGCLLPWQTTSTLTNVVSIASHFATISISLPQNSNSVKYNRKDVKLANQASLPKSAIAPKAMFSLQSFCTHFLTLPLPLYTQYQTKEAVLGCKVNFTFCLPDPTLTHQVKKDTYMHKYLTAHKHRDVLHPLGRNVFLI